MLNSKPIEITPYDDEKESNSNSHIDLSTLVAVLISAKIPATTASPKLTQKQPATLTIPEAHTTKRNYLLFFKLYNLAL